METQGSARPAGSASSRTDAPADVIAEVAIVGGGRVGAALAVALARHRLRVAVIDRVDPAAMIDERFDGRASAVALSSQRLLAAIGVWEHLEATAPIREIRVS